MKKCHNSIEESLKQLQTDYIDLFLIHWPGASNIKSSDIANKIYRRESWETLESFYSKYYLFNNCI